MLTAKDISCWQQSAPWQAQTMCKKNIKAFLRPATDQGGRTCLLYYIVFLLSFCICIYTLYYIVIFIYKYLICIICILLCNGLGLRSLCADLGYAWDCMRRCFSPKCASLCSNWCPLSNQTPTVATIGSWIGGFPNIYNLQDLCFEFS